MNGPHRHRAGRAVAVVVAVTFTALATSAATPAPPPAPTPQASAKPSAKATPKAGAKPSAKATPKAGATSAQAPRPPRTATSPTACPRPPTTPAAEVPTWAQRQLGTGMPRPTFEGWGVTVAVVSSGVDATHPQLAGRVMAGVSLGGAGDPRADCLGLGTAVAGAIAAGPSVDSAAVSPVRGLAPRARILPIRVPDGVAHPSGYLTGDAAQRVGDDLAAAVRAAVQHGADVVVLPAVALPATPVLRSATAQAEGAGVLVVTGEPSSLRAGFVAPLTYPEVAVAVPSDATGALVGNASPIRQALRHVAAPGVGVGVLLPGGAGVLDDPAVAAGWLAGAAAMLVDADPRRTPAELRRRLFTGPVRDGVPRLDPAAALAAPREPGSPAATGAGPGDGSGDAVPFRGAVPPSSRSTSWSVGVALGWLGVTALVGLLAAAWTRGRSRGWRPAPPVDLERVGHQPPAREI